ncbi:uncharacterized mitochondrial protein AtMg00810-like [Juglans microcarpa x Juglans regia]|uniref:uncharacterized mitochondrial protein AtMg00810-like n=1 Tax=Juglans microcarpa x Juglans regia TaxID=2249226 RepID=UPI001B7E52FF|nr:uncharacterized mitochondrial protein AtMg00810-like [Juglans microcarpa x Juglans regia]
MARQYQELQGRRGEIFQQDTELPIGHQTIGPFALIERCAPLIWDAHHSVNIRKLAKSGMELGEELEKWRKGGWVGDFLVYVDDIVIICNDLNAVNSLRLFLQSNFKLKDLEHLKYFLGLEVARSTAGISICQRKCTLEILANLLATKPSTFLMEQNLKLSKSDGELIVDPKSCRRLIGRLLYLTTDKPDIAYTVNTLSQFPTQPCQPHFTAVQRILRYLKSRPGQGHFFPSSSKLQLRAFCDSNWAGCPDTRRSVSGFSIFLGDSLVSWKSKKQVTMSQSSAEAKCMSMVSTCFELLRLSILFKDLLVEIPSPYLLFCDNNAALHIAVNPVFHEHTKHIDIDCHLI